MSSLSLDQATFKALDANPEGTLELFDKYIQHIKLIFELAFLKGDGTHYEPSDKEKKVMLLFRGGDDMKDLFEHVGAVTDTDTFDAAVTKIRTGSLLTIGREVNHLKTGQKKSAMPPNL